VGRDAAGRDAADLGEVDLDTVVPGAEAATALGAAPLRLRRRPRVKVRAILRGGGAAPLHKIGDPIHRRKLARVLGRQPRIRQAHGAQPSDAEFARGLEHVQ
jgi:hypothetical protein